MTRIFNWVTTPIVQSSNLLLVFILFILFSCKDKNKDACENKCQNKSTCENGKCVCPRGYTGEYCEKMFSYRFVGTYTVKDEGNFYLISDTGKKTIVKVPMNQTYTSVITQGDVPYWVNITNFYNSGTTCIASVGNDSIKIIRGLKYKYKDINDKYINYDISLKQEKSTNWYLPIDNRLIFIVKDTSYTIDTKTKDTINTRITDCTSTFTKQ